MRNDEVNYAMMYHKMMNAAEDAINILIKVQRECEELYLCGSEETERRGGGTVQELDDTDE